MDIHKTLADCGALRQLKHNDGSEGLVFAYDKEMTTRYIAQLHAALGDQSTLGLIDERGEFEAEARRQCYKLERDIEAPDNYNHFLTRARGGLGKFAPPSPAGAQQTIRDMDATRAFDAAIASGRLVWGVAAPARKIAFAGFMAGIKAARENVIAEEIAQFEADFEKTGDER